jgi:hypothetical protein
VKIKKFQAAPENDDEGSRFEINFGGASDHRKNAFSILIGENGTRKSRTLRDIIDIAAPMPTRQRATAQGKAGRIDFWLDQEKASLPTISRMLAVSGVATDRFPSRLTSKTRSRWPAFYRYVGPRTENNLVSRVQSINQIALSLLENPARVKSRYKQLKHAFAILKLSHGILFTFEASLPESAKAWTQRDLLSRLKTSRNEALGARLDDPEFLRRCVNILKSKADIELRLDLDDIVRIDASLEDLEGLWFLLSAGVLSVRESYAVSPSNIMLPLIEFSSGQWHMLSSLLLTALAVEDDALILVDEPENSLHPAWQQEYLRLMQSVISSSSGVHVLVATHSPLIAASLSADEAEVIQIRSSSNRLIARPLPGGPFGWTADQILQEVFGLKSSRSVGFTQYMDEALALFAKGDRTNSKLKRLVEKLVRTLPDLPEDDVTREMIETLALVLQSPSHRGA